MNAPAPVVPPWLLLVSVVASFTVFAMVADWLAKISIFALPIGALVALAAGVSVAKTVSKSLGQGKR